MKTLEKRMKIGILGGGQLARMMALEAHRMGLEIWILSNDANDPAAQVCPNWVKGSISKVSDVLKFSKKVDVLTFESEFVAPEVLIDLGKKKIKAFPKVQHMLKWQDRLSQKNLLEKYKVPTSPFKSVKSIEEIKKAGFNLPLVLKARRDGYDGKGTYILKSWTDKKAETFISQIDSGIIVENFIPFKRELAISVVRSSNGDLEFFPLVESFQEECRCLWVKGPIKHSKESSLKKKLKALVEKEKYVGFISFELFDTGKDLIINEVAPRVHNSAHYSQDGLLESQFTAHLKAVSGDKIAKVQLKSGGFAMYNLIGSSNSTPKWVMNQEVNLHWYGKADNRAGRKMGHLNTIGKNAADALKKVLKAKKDFKL